MAGIGFELSKAIREDSVKGRVSGYTGAAFSSSGSVIVGIILFFFIQLAAKHENIPQTTIDSFMCYVTNTMFFSMIVTSTLSLVISRYVSNKIYEGKYEKVMPSLIGSATIIAIIGGVAFLILLAISCVPFYVTATLMLLYLILSLCWLLTSYVTLIRDYKWVVIAYVVAFLTSASLLILLRSMNMLGIISMIITLGVCFAVVDIVLFRAVYRAFPKQDGTYFSFLSEIKQSPSLCIVGFLMMFGMLGHFWVTWFSSTESLIANGLFRFGPNYDFPAIVAYFSTIPASIYFVTMFETSFGEKYQKYFYILGHSGTVDEVNVAKDEMFDAIRLGLRRMFSIQLVSCLISITVGAKILAILNIGMTEMMLETFRMFCVGYSLYFVANTLFMLHLYFMNEDKVVIPTLIFALLTSITAYLSAKYLEGTYGMGFTFVSAVLVVVLAIQLVKYLYKLEHHVFSKQSSNKNEGKKNVKKMKKTIGSNKKIKFALVSGTVCILIMVTSLANIVSQRIMLSNIYEYIPEKSDEVLLSPGMGLAPWAESDESLELETTLVYVELKWSDWEPEEGFYNVEFVNEFYNLDYYKKDGRNVVFRFICDEPTEEEHLDIPEWLYQKIDGDGTWYDIDYGKGFSPNYSNKIFIEEHGEAISALGEYFGQDDFFIYVELGSLGHWGEWHVNYEKGITPMPEFAIREEYIKPYLNAFQNSSFLIRYPLVDAEKYGFGLYNDMTGDYDETVYWLEQMKPGIWEQTNLEEQADTKDVWKKYPIGGEFASSYENSHFLLTNFDLTLEGIKDSHQSFIGPKIIIDESEKDYSSAMNKILKTIGYRYYVDSVLMDFNEKETFTITCSMSNDGIAPTYQKYSIELSIVDEDGNEVWISDNVDFDLRNVLPNESQTFSCVVSKDELDDDAKYQLVISIQDESGKAVLPLALANEIDTNRYQLTTFSVK